jgi:hypothetical protein
MHRYGSKRSVMDMLSVELCSSHQHMYLAEVCIAVLLWCRWLHMCAACTVGLLLPVLDVSRAVLQKVLWCLHSSSR